MKNKDLQKEFEQLPIPDYEPDFKIYRDGQLDRMYEAKKLFLRSSRALGRGIGFVAVEAFNMADTFIVEMNKQAHG